MSSFNRLHGKSNVANAFPHTYMKAFITALTRYPQQSYMQLLNSLRDELKSKYSQKPQLSASHPMDCNLLFIA
ncbi:Ca(2+)-dependent cysteine protease [Naganishia friedmannii]|uniref:Ca(2+)-dependent cysteine protease n=1 Tax=Naganishia friedmannii TaxID=89922 RepID=A0ACC2VCR5_9TREE|nr:Ca(2+)-dependent cysteine protease [Naganishia friedmannii]